MRLNYHPVLSLVNYHAFSRLIQVGRISGASSDDACHDHAADVQRLTSLEDALDADRRAREQASDRILSVTG